MNNKFCFSCRWQMAANDHFTHYCGNPANDSVVPDFSRGVLLRSVRVVNPNDSCDEYARKPEPETSPRERAGD
jgi:hypothetical protein